MPFHETATVFGPEANLVGVLTLPTQEGPREHRIGCLLLNVGVNHRISPRRMNVKTARRMAAAGIPSLRFDLSGIGDSRASTAARNFRDQALCDMRAALDHFQVLTGIERFVVFGVCSGAANSLTLAVADPRVIGLTMLDGHAFLSKAVRLRRKLRRWMAFPFNAAVRRGYHGWRAWSTWTAAPWDGEARRQFFDSLRRRAPPQSTEQTGILTADALPYGPADFARDMTTLVERQVDVFVMFTNTLTAKDRHRDLLSQLGDAPFLQRVHYKFWPHIDHTVTTLAAQSELLDTVCAWAEEVRRRQKSVAVEPLRIPRDAPLQPSLSTLEQAPA